MPRAQEAQERRLKFMRDEKKHIGSCNFGTSAIHGGRSIVVPYTLDTPAILGGRIPRAHDCMDAGGRATHGAVAEELRLKFKCDNKKVQRSGVVNSCTI